jgi:hypothetical protein
MHAIREVDVQATGRSEHHLGPWGFSAVAVRSRVEVSSVSLRLYDTDRRSALRRLTNQNATDEIWGDLEGVSLIEGFREPPGASRCH